MPQRASRMTQPSRLGARHDWTIQPKVVVILPLWARNRQAMTESAMSGEDRAPGATGDTGSGVLMRALLVIGITVSLALYILAQYTEHIGKILAKAVPNHDVVALLVEVGAALPALAVMPFLGGFIEL